MITYRDLKPVPYFKGVVNVSPAPDTYNTFLLTEIKLNNETLLRLIEIDADIKYTVTQHSQIFD